MDSIVIILAKIDRSPFFKPRKRSAGYVSMLRDSFESDLVDSTSYRFCGFVQTRNAFGGFTILMRKFC